jgi:hypothetical protein
MIIRTLLSPWVALTAINAIAPPSLSCIAVLAANHHLQNQFEDLYPEFTPDSLFSDLNVLHNPYPEQYGGSPNDFIAEADFGFDLRSGAFHDRDEDPLTPARLRRRAQNRAA